ncbi:hypothetical protein UY3_01221, partial [Chelonia mydas]
HLYLQRIHIANPTERVIAFEASTPSPPSSVLGAKFVTSLEKVGDRQFLFSSGRVLLASSSKVVLVVVAAKKLVTRVQVAPKSHFHETVLSVVYTSEPIEPSSLEETFSKLRELAKKEMLEVMQMGVEELFQEHQQTWSDLFISGVEMRKITDSHTPSSKTVNMTLYYVLSCMPAPLLDPLIGGEDREKMEANLNYADHCFSGHATMHAENLWPEKLSSVPQILQLSDLWKLTLQKRGCKSLVAAGVHGLMQGMVLSFGGLQFTENHLQFQADPDVLHNSYSLRGIHYNKDLINLAVLLDAEGKPFLHVSVKFQDKPVRLYACEAGCLNEPVELTSELRGHTFPVMVTQPITPLLYISTDLTHLQDLRHTLHLKAILAHEEHMAKQYPGLPFLFWFSVASLITLFHLFLFKLIYNEYCGPGAKPLFRKTEETLYSKNHQCMEEKGSACGIYITKMRERLNTTWDIEPGVVLSRVISELLEAFDSPNEDLISVRSNPDWADVMSLRLILRIKEVILRAHEIPKASPPPRSLQSAWQPVTTILNYAIFTSENVQTCWMENMNLSRYFTLYEGISLFIPFLGSSPPIPSRSLAKELNYVQSCLLQKGHEKLQRKSKEIISTISLKITLLVIACLIYPIVLVSFKQMTDWIQNYARSLKERTEDLKRERRLAEDLLHQMLPKSVAKQLRKHKHVQAENYDQVTIFFSDIVGFTSIAASCTPLQVVEMLNNLYNCFDTRIESYDVYKIETIGDAYMVVSGLPERNGEKHADEIAKMSLDLVAAVRQVLIPHMPRGRLQLRAGIHTGPCVAGVVGYKMPRYCLFGDTVNTASRMESTSLPQKIHISSATYQALLMDDAYEIELRGEIEIKGKGKMKTYWLLGNKNYSVQNDSLVCHWNPAISRKKKMENSPMSAQQQIAKLQLDRTALGLRYPLFLAKSIMHLNPRLFCCSTGLLLHPSPGLDARERIQSEW